MSYMLFVDESGHDASGSSPYVVLAGICIEDRDLWRLICQVHDAEERFFGQRVSPGDLELKGKKLLKRKTFRLASQLPEIAPEERTGLARRCLERGRDSKGDPGGGGVTRRELTALAQAKLAFVGRLLELWGDYGVRVFASIVDRDAERPEGDFLRKDYAYLFERYFYFLEDRRERAGDPLGLVVFDELERSQCHILIEQMSRYFRETATGKMRASRIIPEPFFVHSELTTAVQMADVAAYIVAWGVRVGGMDRPRREELSDLARLVCDLRYRTVRDGFRVWSFAVIDDLRPREEKEGEDAG